MDIVNICAECGAPLEQVALVDLVVTYEPDNVENDIFEQEWHRDCFVTYHLRQTSRVGIETAIEMKETD